MFIRFPFKPQPGKQTNKQTNFPVKSNRCFLSGVPALIEAPSNPLQNLPFTLK